MYKYYRPQIRSRHPSHNPLRKKGILPMFPFKSVIRFGSTTELPDSITNGGDRIEINLVKAIQNSSNKLLMKTKFVENKISTADWWTYNDLFIFENNEDAKKSNIEELPYPIIVKNIYGSRGQGNYKIDSKELLEQWIKDHQNKIGNYIFEKFYNYNREYRLHVTSEGCFYTCRKMLKKETPQEKRWYRNDDNCNWILEENELFDKPNNWNKIEKECIKSLNAVGLDIGAVDLRIQSNVDKNGNKRDNPDFIIVEINSAPSFGDITLEKYIKELPKIILNKSNEK